MLNCDYRTVDNKVLLKVKDGPFEGVEFFFGDMTVGDELPEGGAMLNYTYFITSEKTPDNVPKFEEELNSFILKILEEQVENANKN